MEYISDHSRHDKKAWFCAACLCSHDHEGRKEQQVAYRDEKRRKVKQQKAQTKAENKARKQEKWEQQECQRKQASH